ncbi:DUF4255 domain-containing protein [uncultured Microscilla sp.]|uniref:DUF4255 domain-containing protein n=1 Tax=uncultured Microscilla sp. TaxID=432653 RepID=UPI00262E13ED|nr:DUF4255 domain-containing protein [uncultured Microscilla sp.]
MVHEAIEFLKTALNNYLLQKIPDSTVTAPRVDYPKIDTDPPVFNLRTVNLVLINLEEERVLRPADPYAQVSSDGTHGSVSPPLSVILTLLFSAKFTDYQAALKHLSFTMQFFQSNQLFTPEDFPGMPDGIDKLTVEFQSLNNAQKNEIWSSLKVAYLPSVVYKLRMLVYQQDSTSSDTLVTQTSNQNTLLR